MDIEYQVEILDAIADVAGQLRHNLWDEGAYEIPGIVLEIRRIAKRLEELEKGEGSA